MKRFLALICMITCIFGLTACGGEEGWVSLADLPAVQDEVTYEQWKLREALLIAEYDMVPLLAGFMDQDADSIVDKLTMEELEYQIQLETQLEVDGYAFYTAVESFRSAHGSIGGIADIGEATAKVDGDQIIVHVPVTGEKKDATAEVILSNDMFFKLESAALNPVSTMGELMVNAALNTVIGMGTVFAVLILISCIISCFSIIPKLQKNAAEKKAAKAAGREQPVVDSVIPPVVQEEVPGDDDRELAAVIAAAIAAFEGSASTDGFVVRSIRRR